jgi:hypothetical protein
MLRSEGRFLYPLFPYTIEIRMLHPNAPMATELGEDLDRVTEGCRRTSGVIAASSLNRGDAMKRPFFGS